jgi:DNA-binding PadR family transcriptional regulator
MKQKRTATTANAILGLLALRPAWSTYSITKQLRRNMRFFWPRVESRIYDEARQLIERGQARAYEEQVGRRPRTVYSITPEGQQTLREWLATPPSATKLECEPLLRIFLADLCTQEQLHAALEQVRADADAILSVGRVVGPEYIEGVAPFQDQVHVRALVFDFLWNHAKMLEQWADRTEMAIERWNVLSPAEKAEAALATIQRNLDTEAPEAG